MYMEIKRAHIDYMLASFDAPTTVQSCPRRERSNTPLQALTLMNDPLFVQCARELARRAITHSDDDRQRIRYIVQRAVARPPAPEDFRDLETLLAAARAHYRAHQEATARIAGEDLAADPREGAAWVVLARTVLNVDEVITRE